MDNLVYEPGVTGHKSEDDEPRFTLDVTGLFADTTFPFNSPEAIALLARRRPRAILEKEVFGRPRA